MRFSRTGELRTRWESELNTARPNLRPWRPDNENHEGSVKDDNDDWYFSEEVKERGTQDDDRGRHRITRGGVVKPKGRLGCPGDAVFRCNNGKEVCLVNVCDGVMDCFFGEDETRCRKCMHMGCDLINVYTQPIPISYFLFFLCLFPPTNFPT